jgi:putative ABC transport system substrate-binding protein
MTSRALQACAAALVGIGLVVVAGGGQAQSGKVYRVGLLSPSPALFLVEPFLAEMRELGWVEGQHFTLERRFAGPRLDAADTLARELVDLVSGTAVAARRATTRVPIVMITSGYPVEAGLAESLARPGGNVTGNSPYVGGEVFGKYVELLRTLSPRMTRLGVLWDYLPPVATRVETDLSVGELRRAAQAFGITLVTWEVRAATDIEDALAAFAKGRSEALFVSSGPVHALPEVASRVADFAVRRRIPTISDLAGGFFRQGGLMAYSPNPAALGRRAAYFVDRILRGARPGDLPIERPAKFDLVAHARLARTLGLTIPPVLLLRADQVID